MPGNNYYVVAYDRRTERWRQSFEVRPSLRERVLAALGIEQPEPGEDLLSEAQVMTLAGILPDFTPDLERLVYTLDTQPEC